MSLVITQNLVLGPKECDDLRSHYSKLCWNNVTSSITASSETEGYIADNALSQQTYESWIPESMPATCGVMLTSAISFIGIAAHNLGETATTVKAEYWDGLAYQLIGETLPADNSSLVFLFDEIATAKIRLTFTGATAPSIGVIQAGDVLTMPANLDSGFVDMFLMDLTDYGQNFSEGGQLLGRKVVSKGLEGQPSWTTTEFEWIATHFYPFDLYARESAFFFIPHPQSRPSSVYYSWLSGKISYRGRNRQYIPIQMSLRAYASQ